MTDTHKAKYQACADAGMSQADTARFLCVDRSQVSRWARVYGIKFKCGHPIAVDKLGHLTDAQIMDHETLVTLGGYSVDQALATVLKPKVKIRGWARA